MSSIFTNDRFFVGLMVIIVALASFGLGRLAERSRGSVAPQSAAVVQVVQTSTTSREVVASSNGTKYHFPWCAGAERISPQNLLVFATAEAARAAGYEPAANCRGLE